MNPIKNLLMTMRISADQVVVLPFVLVREEDTEGHSNALTIPLQFDSNQTEGKHVAVTFDNYAQAPVCEIKGKEEVLIYLAKAEKNRLSDVRFEIPFADGILWGWFPKQFAQ